MAVVASLNRYRQAPRKVRLIADLVRGKKVDDALAQLSFLAKRGRDPMIKLIRSAVSNAEHNFKLPKEELYIKEISVNPGPVMKRGMPRAFGRSYLIRKRTSHIKVVLDIKEKKEKKEKKVVAKKPVKKSVKLKK